MIIPPAVYPFISQDRRVVVLVVQADKNALVTLHRKYGRVTEIVRGCIDVEMRNDEMLFIDFEVPQDINLTYWITVKSGSEEERSKDASIGPFDFGRDVLIDLDDPKRSMLTYVESFKQYKYGINRDVQKVWGRPDPVVISGVRQTLSGDLVLLTLELSERENLLDILEFGSVVAFTPQKREFGLDPIMYMAVGEVTEDRVVFRASETARRFTLNVQQVTAPPADFRPPTYGRTWREFRANTWRIEAAHQWWEAVAL